MSRIFLSYDHEDVAFAKPLAVALEKAGHTVWYDRHIHGGAQYSQKIEQALDAADAVVVLWSQRSLESAWVRDEAAEGRDRGKLVPLSIGGATPPMGFRQYQTIELGAWQGRGKVPRLQELLQAVESQAEELPPSDAEPKIDKALRRSIEYRKRPLRWWGIAALVALAALTAAGGVWWSRTASLPVVEVAAANSSAKSKAAASDLYVKLGSLAQVGQGKWRLIDGSSNSDKPDLSFRTADTGLPGSPRANLVLLDKSGSLLWSREFAPPPGGSEADLRQQVSITAGRVLGCSLDSSENGGLPRDELKLFLTTCAAGLEAAYADNVSITRQLRSIVQNHPHFKPAWKQLLLSQMTVVDFNNLGAEGTEETENLRQLRADVENARKAFPDLAQITLAEVHLLPRVNYLQELALFQKAISQAPDDPSIQAEQLQPLMRVGRMLDGVTAARRAVQLDPLSAHAQMQLILSLAYAGQIGEAREELAKLEQQWPDSGTVKDARWAFNLRFGDPRIAAAMTSRWRS